MFKGLRGLFSNDLSIDLGTANTLIYVRGQVSCSTSPQLSQFARIEAPAARARCCCWLGCEENVGPHAGQYSHGQAAQGWRHCRLSMTEEMLKQFIRKVHRSRMLRPSPRVLVCVPCGSTQVERRAIKESAESAARATFSSSKSLWPPRLAQVFR